MAQADIGTIAARQQSQHASTAGDAQLGELELVQTLCPFQLLYSDGIERLGADSPQERVRWVSAIWDVLDRAVSIPDRSMSGSPTNSVRTGRSFTSTATSESGNGSASTRYMPLLENIPDISDLQSLSGSSGPSILSRGPSLVSTHRTRAADDSAISGQTYLYPGDPRVIGPSRSSSMRRTSSLTDLDQEFASALRRARDARPGLGFGMSLVSGVPVGDGSPVTVSSGPRLGRNVFMSPPPSVGRGATKSQGQSSGSSTGITDEAFFSARTGSDGTRQTSSYYSSSSFTNGLTTTESKTYTGLVTDETVIDIVSGSGTNIVPSTLSFRGTASASLLGDSHSGSSDGLHPPAPSSRSGLSRTGGVRRRTPRSRDRSSSSSCISSTEGTSDKENTCTYTPTMSRSVTDGFSTLESYTRTDSYTPTPSSYSRASEGTLSDLPPSTVRSSESLPHARPRTPSELSYVSLPSIPSLDTDYETADVCSTDYETAPKCPSEPITEYETAEICPSDVTTDYNTAECRCVKPEDEGEEDVVSITPPSSIPTIPSPPASEDGFEIVQAPDITPPSLPYRRRTVPRAVQGEQRASADLERTPSIPEEMLSISVISPSDEPLSPSEEPESPPRRQDRPFSRISAEVSSVSILDPSPIPPSPSPPELPSVSSVSTPTESSVTPTPSSVLTPSAPSNVPQPPTSSSPAVPASLWAPETDGSYESSIVGPSPSIQSLAIPEVPDVSFETSFLRPSGSIISSEEALTPISEISTPSPITLSSSRSPSLTPTPSSISLAPSVPSPTPMPSEAAPHLVAVTRTPSSVSAASSVSMRSSILYPRSLSNVPPPPIREPSTVPSLLPSVRSLTPSRITSPPSVPLPPSPAPSAPSVPPSLSMSVSITTPRGDAPSIMSTLETIASEAPSQILTHDVNRLLQYLHEINEIRGAENRDMTTNIQEIRRVLEQFRDEQIEMHQRTQAEIQQQRIQTEIHQRAQAQQIPQMQQIPTMVPIPQFPQVPPMQYPSAPGAVRLPTRPPAEEYRRDQEYDMEEREVPPPVPRKDRAVGGSTVISSDGPPRPTLLTPPPMRLPSPDTLSESMSFLSSHHSDDLSLMESVPYPIMQVPGSPSWPSESSSFPESSPPSTLRSRSPTPVRVPPSREGSSPFPLPIPMRDRDQPPLPSGPPSPSPSVVSLAPSDATARPVPSIDYSQLRDMIIAVREELAVLREGQMTAGMILEELRGRPVGQDVADCCRRLEEAIQRVMDQSQRAPRPPPRDDISEYPSVSESSLAEHFRRLHEELSQQPPIQMPIPTRVGPSFDERIIGILSEEQPSVRQPVLGPPPITHLRYRPGLRATRPRSVSPVFEVDLPRRPGTFPVTQLPLGYPGRAPESRYPGREPESRYPGRETESRMGDAGRGPSHGLPPGPDARAPYPPSTDRPYPPPGPPSEERMPYPPRVAGLQSPYQPLTGLDDTAGGTVPGEDIDFDEQVRRLRAQRRPDVPSGYFHAGRTGPPRTAPPALADVPPPQQVFPPGMPLPGVQPPGAPPPGTFAQVPSVQSLLQLPIDDILALLRENRNAHNASLEQQREIMRYLRDLNDWFARDVHDRHAEVRGVNERLDHIDDVLEELRHGRGPGVIVAPPQPMPPRTGVPSGPGMPEPFVVPDAGRMQAYPPGPVAPPPVIPPPGGYEDRTPPHEGPPVIPATPPPAPYPGPGAPVLPGFPYAPAAPVLPFPQPRPSAVYDEDVVPSSPEYSPTESITPTGSSIEESPPLFIPGPPGPPPVVQPQGPPGILQPSHPPTFVQVTSQEGSPSASPIMRDVDRAGLPSRSASPLPVPSTEPGVGIPRHPGVREQLPSPEQPTVFVPPPGEFVSMPTAPMAPQPEVIAGDRPSSATPAIVRLQSRSRSPGRSTARSPVHVVLPSRRDDGRESSVIIRVPSAGPSRIPPAESPMVHVGRSPPPGFEGDPGRYPQDPGGSAQDPRRRDRSGTPHHVLTRSPSPVTQIPRSPPRGPSPSEQFRPTRPAPEQGAVSPPIGVYDPSQPGGGYSPSESPSEGPIGEREDTGPPFGQPVTQITRSPPRDPTILDIPQEPHSPYGPLPVPEPTRLPDSPSGGPERAIDVARSPSPIGEVGRAVSGPGDLALEEAERQRDERFGALERRFEDTVSMLQHAEEGRDEAFRANEDERERLFLEHEQRREQEAVQRRDEIWRQLEDRLAALTPAPLPVPPPDVELAEPEPEPPVEEEEEQPPGEATLVPPPVHPDDMQNIRDSVISVVTDASARHAQEILDTVQLEREELARERELERAERERLYAEAEAARAQASEEREARVRLLEEELATVRAELENERQLRAVEETERRERERAEMLERDEAMRNQLTELTNLVSEQREELTAKREASDARWNEKLEWMQRKDAQDDELRGFINQILANRNDDRAWLEEWRTFKESQPSTQDVLARIEQLKEDQQQILDGLYDRWRSHCDEMHERTMEAVRSTAQEQVPFNIQAYLDEFSRSLASEVRMLLGEVGRLREERRNLQYELGCLLTMKSKMGPGGEFDPDWKPATGPCARDNAPPAEAPPPPPPPPPEEPMAARPGWRQVMPSRAGRRSRRSQSTGPLPPPPPEPQPPARPADSWPTWRPDPAYVPTPPSVQIEPQLLSPPQPSPGLFGPRTPRSSIYRG
ncbi:hypothetical protein WOLCODRAFT_158154 [Wolfiporia cocos MD-104 SS10]|uniref:PH domain-containing protein n=1 Tax=Wolfiporia cocos (strain MD-104) TaxID=742152 RepID=A0A2H3JLB9_WOLCO|nr:hypothetical protein WOLCODRAFT_158154 [Wolfiporia cocos MD-104 SS10]